MRERATDAVRKNKAKAESAVAAAERTMYAAQRGGSGKSSQPAAADFQQAQRAAAAAAAELNITVYETEVLKVRLGCGGGARSP